MVDNDELDCMQWIRSDETLRAEEKQYGSWLRATPERLQKPQLVFAKGEWGGRKTEGQEESSGEEGARPCKTVMATRTDRSTGPETAGGEHVMSDVAILDPLMSHQICHIPENLQVLAFEKQIREID